MRVFILKETGENRTPLEGELFLDWDNHIMTRDARAYTGSYQILSCEERKEQLKATDMTLVELQEAIAEAERLRLFYSEEGLKLTRIYNLKKSIAKLQQSLEEESR